MHLWIGFGSLFSLLKAYATAFIPISLSWESLLLHWSDGELNAALSNIFLTFYLQVVGGGVTGIRGSLYKCIM